MHLLTVESVLKSEALLKIMEVILAVVNFMSTSPRQITGFHVSDLERLADTKSADQKTTLLHWLVDKVFFFFFLFFGFFFCPCFFFPFFFLFFLFFFLFFSPFFPFFAFFFFFFVFFFCGFCRRLDHFVPIMLVAIPHDRNQSRVTTSPPPLSG